MNANLYYTYCGTRDDDDFHANEMCCACGGGRYGITLNYYLNSNKVIFKINFCRKVNITPYSQQLLLGKCVNLDGNKTDKEGRGCDAYSEASTVYHDDRCAKYDDEDFASLEMCCNCGGGGFGNFMFRFLIISSYP